MSDQNPAQAGSAWAELQAAHVLRLTPKSAVNMAIDSPAHAEAASGVDSTAQEPPSTERNAPVEAAVSAVVAKKIPEVSKSVLTLAAVGVALVMLAAVEHSVYQQRHLRTALASVQPWAQRVPGLDRWLASGPADAAAAPDAQPFALASLPERVASEESSGAPLAGTAAGVAPATVPVSQAPVASVSADKPATVASSAIAAVAANAAPASRASSPPAAPQRPKPSHVGKTKAVAGPAASDAAWAQYEILAIEPHQGERQQAWVRDAKGQTHIVQAGDSLAGVRVLSVSFADGTVKTAQGSLRQ